MEELGTDEVEHTGALCNMLVPVRMTCLCFEDQSVVYAAQGCLRKRADFVVALLVWWFRAFYMFSSWEALQIPVASQVEGPLVPRPATVAHLAGSSVEGRMGSGPPTNCALRSAVAGPFSVTRLHIRREERRVGTGSFFSTGSVGRPGLHFRGRCSHSVQALVDAGEEEEEAVFTYSLR